MEKIEFRQIRDFGQLVGDTFVFIKQNWKPLLKTVFTIAGFFLIASAATALVYQMKLFSGTSAGESIRSGRVFGWEYFLNLAFAMLTSTLIGLTTFSYISLYVEKNNTPPSTEEVWAYVKYFFWRFLGIGIVLTLLFFAGFVLCFIPGIYLIPSISVMMAMIVFENAGLGYVFDRGFKLVKGNWWTTFGALIILVIVIYVLTMLFVLPTQILSGANMFLLDSPRSMPLLILTVVFGSLYQVLFVLMYVTTALAYFSLVEKKEGASLLDKVNTIGKDGFSSDLPEEQY